MISLPGEYFNQKSLLKNIFFSDRGLKLCYNEKKEGSPVFRNLLSPDSGLMITMSHITDCIFLSLFWLLGCIPVITLTTSFAAMYDATFRGIRKGDKLSWQRFFHVYKENWKAGILPSLFTLAAGYGLVRGMVALWNAAVAGSASWMVFSGVALVCVLVLGMVSILAPMISRFENSFLGYLRNCLLLGFAHLPRTLALGVITAAAGLVCVRWIFPVFFAPSLGALLSSFFIEPMFRPYLPAEEEEEAE